MRLERALRRIGNDLHELKRSWALVGGLAVSIRAEPRFTRDLDLALSVQDDREAEAICSDLLRRGYRLLASLEQEVTGRLAAVRLEPPDEQGLVVDLLFASSGIESEVVAAAEVLEVLPRLRVPVARTGHLMALKVLAANEVRPQDQGDLIALEAKASPGEIERARSALSMIADRGYNRGKDLAAEWQRLLPSEDTPPPGYNPR